MYSSINIWDFISINPGRWIIVTTPKSFIKDKISSESFWDSRKRERLKTKSLKFFNSLVEPSIFINSIKNIFINDRNLFLKKQIKRSVLLQKPDQRHVIELKAQYPNWWKEKLFFIKERVLWGFRVDFTCILKCSYNIIKIKTMSFFRDIL